MNKDSSSNRRQPLYHQQFCTTVFYQHALFETEEGQDIGLSYLKERGFREDIIKKFQLGYSPEQRDAFTKEAIAKQFNH